MLPEGPPDLFHELLRMVRRLGGAYTPIKTRMWVWREAVPGGFRYHVYRTSVNARVDYLGVNYLYGVGWHPELDTFVSLDDDLILRRRGFLRLEEDAEEVAPRSGPVWLRLLSSLRRICARS